MLHYQPARGIVYLNAFDGFLAPDGDLVFGWVWIDGYLLFWVDLYHSIRQRPVKSEVAALVENGKHG